MVNLTSLSWRLSKCITIGQKWLYILLFIKLYKKCLLFHFMSLSREKILIFFYFSLKSSFITYFLLKILEIAAWIIARTLILYNTFTIIQVCNGYSEVLYLNLFYLLLFSIKGIVFSLKNIIFRKETT